MMPAMTRVYLARHGETDWNRVGRWQGHADVPLNDAGRAQAQALARRAGPLQIEKIYTSDLARARQTADVVADQVGLTAVIAPDLREVDVGSWSGLSRAEARRRHPAGYRRWLAGRTGWDDGETYEALHARAVAAFERICADQPGRTLLLVTHAGPIRAIASHALGLPSVLDRIRIGGGANGSLSLVERLEAGLQLAILNDEGHL
jgi:broad specificity phosphatase PhoE